jgi:hypothetical protein
MNKEDTLYIQNYTSKGGTKPSKEMRKRKAEQSSELSSSAESTLEKVQQAEEKLKESIWKMKNVDLQIELKKHGLPSNGVKLELVARLLLTLQREKLKLIKKTEREKDPLRYKEWWNASIIVNLFKWEARRLTRTPVKVKKVTK